MFSGVLAMGFFRTLAAIRSWGGTRGSIGFLSSAYAIATVVAMTATAITPDFSSIKGVPGNGLESQTWYGLEEKRAGAHSNACPTGNSSVIPYLPSKLRSYVMINQASSSVIAAGINGTIGVGPPVPFGPLLPFLITHIISPSVRFLWNFGLVKFRGAIGRIAPAGPSPFPLVPWQFKQVPLPSNRAFPLAMFSGVLATGFFNAFAAAR